MTRKLLTGLISLSAICAWPKPTAAAEPQSPEPHAPMWFASTTPTLGTTLTKGSAVDLRVDVESSTPQVGRIVLSITDDTDRPLVVTAPVEIGGRERITLQASFGVPKDASTVRVVATFKPTERAMKPVAITGIYPTGDDPIPDWKSDGPCQCYPPQQQNYQVCIGGPTCAELTQWCKSQVAPASCEQGSVCAHSLSCFANCGVVTNSSGQQIGWRQDCWRNWKCYYCD